MEKNFEQERRYGGLTLEECSGGANLAGLGEGVLWNAMGDLAERIAELEAENARLNEEIVRWKCATLLNDGHGDPDGVAPDDLEREMTKLRSYLDAAEEKR